MQYSSSVEDIDSSEPVLLTDDVTNAMKLRILGRNYTVCGTFKEKCGAMIEEDGGSL